MISSSSNSRWKKVIDCVLIIKLRYTTTLIIHAIIIKARKERRIIIEIIIKLGRIYKIRRFLHSFKPRLNVVTTNRHHRHHLHCNLIIIYRIRRIFNLLRCRRLLLTLRIIAKTQLRLMQQQASNNNNNNKILKKTNTQTLNSLINGSYAKLSITQIHSIYKDNYKSTTQCAQS